MNLPNLLSIFRLFLTSLFIVSINQGRFRVALYLFVLQGISDMLDGFFARIMGKKTYLGAFLDPIADKVMLVSSFTVLYLQGIIPLWVTCVVLLRDFVISSGFLILYKLSYKVKPSPAFLGKLATVSQIITIIYILWSHTRTYEVFFFYATIFFTVVSGFQYILRGFRILLKKEVVC